MGCMCMFAVLTHDSTCWLIAYVKVVTSGGAQFILCCEQFHRNDAVYIKFSISKV